MNPNGDSTDLAGGFPGAESNDTSEKVQTNFCADCHNNNPNWDTSSDDSGRNNKRSHVQGDAAEGQLKVNGITTTVAGWGTTETVQTTEAGCRSCHAASSAGNSVATFTTADTSLSAFPHQTAGSKLLFDTYNGDTTGSVDDPNRALEGMDQLCLRCHTDATWTGATSNIPINTY